MPIIDDGNNTINSLPLTDQGSAPTAPPTGKHRLFAKSDGVYVENSAGVVTGPLKASTSATDPIYDAKGDLVVGTGVDTAAKLPVGANDYVLTADSAQSTGMKWAAPASSGHTIQDEGTPLTARANLNFIGAAVAVTDDAGNNATKVTITASGDVATDAIWDAKGDLAIGTGANTAAKHSVGTDGTALVADSTKSDGIDWKNLLYGTMDYILVQDQKTQNTAGGTATSGAWRTRDLNTKVVDTGGFASVANNQITLAAGTYVFQIIAPCMSVARHIARLYNITVGTTIATGTSGYASYNASPGLDRSIVEGQFTLAVSSVLEVQHLVETTVSTNGFGLPTNLGPEIYTVAEFWKVNFGNTKTQTGANATGGTISYAGAYKIHTFLSSGTLTVLQPGLMEILVVGGGGAGGTAYGGGGGGGGVNYKPNYWVEAGAVTVTVGNGGQPSYFGMLRGAAGGTGGASESAGKNGGSGGGAGGSGSLTPAVGMGYMDGGNDGGANFAQGAVGPAGGGGGAGAVGGAASSNHGGNGGDGVQLSINGTPTYYGGGGGGSVIGQTPGNGGQGGGGNAAISTGSGSAGTANTGGGGGAPGGAGGSGIVIVRYPTTLIGGNTQYIKIQDNKAQNTAGGTFTAGAWRTRDLNTIVVNEGSLASLSSNQITLPAGTYRCVIHAPALNVSAHQAKLYNVTDAADVLLGENAMSVQTSDGVSVSMVVGQFTIASTKILEVQHRCLVTQATYGFGYQTNWGTEVYTVVELWKINSQEVSLSAMAMSWQEVIVPAYTTPSSSVGSWVLSFWNDVSTITAGYGITSGGAQNDYVAWKRPLSSGTWSISIHVRESTNTGIATIYVDGVSVGTLDTYHSLQYAKLTLTGVAISTSGVHEIKFVAETKNGSSSGYYLEFLAIDLIRTA